jgi:DNA-binding NarL/FixJ family response regulator
MKRSAQTSGQKVSLRVLIADAAQSSSEGFAALLAESDGIEVIGFADKALRAMAMLDKMHPDVVILDLGLPGDTFNHLSHLLKDHDWSPTLIVLVPYTSKILSSRCRRAGADYVFTKSAELDRISATLRELLEAKRLSEHTRQTSQECNDSAEYK